MSSQQIPVIILKEGTSRSRGRDAQRSNITAAKILAETVRSTLGPRGMDKMMVGTIGDIVITNDGATIMKEMDVQNPAAKMLVEVSKTQDSEVGDGTTTAVVLAGELLSGAETLLDKDVHPNIIIDGYRNAAEKAQEILDEIAVTIKPEDTEQLKRVALTSLNTKGIFGSQEHFADLAVKAVLQVMEMSDEVAATGANVLFTEKGADDEALAVLAKKGILTVKNVSSKDMEKLAKATGGTIAGTLKDLPKTGLGQAKKVEEVKIGDDKHVYVREGKNPKAVTIMIRGGSDHVIDEAERALHDALCVVRNAVEDGKVVAGGGAPEAELSKRLNTLATKTEGREQLAIKAFAEALEAIPVTIAQNAGIDPIDIMVELRQKHNTPANKWYGVNVYEGKTADMWKMNVIGPLRVKKQVIKSAVEAVTMLLRVDDVIASKSPGPMPSPGGSGGMPPGMGGMGGMPPGMMGGM